jgi:hypothetical protein
MLVTNLPAHGGDLSKVFFETLRAPDTQRLRMVSGYVGKEMIAQLHKELSKRDDIAVEMVVGMAAKEGITQATYDALIHLNEELKGRTHPKFKRQGVYAFFSGKDGERSRGMHAKAYLFDRNPGRQLILGSSNFSFSGLNATGNIEMNVIDTSAALADEYAAFFEDLHTNEMAVPIDKVDDFPIRGKAQYKRTHSSTTLVKVKKPTDFKKYKYVDIDLGRNIDRQTRSNLNCCFGKGRWARATGVVRLRDWYEVELISPMDVTSNPSYPKGDFLATTSDGFQFKAVTNGDYFKNFRSQDDLKILGIWLKGCLEDAGALSDDPQEMVTKETFEEYGNSILRIYRPSATTAVLHFPRDPTDL